MTPANIMLTGTGVKVVDFGVSAAVGASGRDGPGGAVIGTPAYLAPERVVTAVYPRAGAHSRRSTASAPAASRSSVGVIRKTESGVPVKPGLFLGAKWSQKWDGASVISSNNDNSQFLVRLFDVKSQTTGDPTITSE